MEIALDDDAIEGRREIATASLAANGGIAVVESLAQALELANEYAPEHMCLAVRDPWNWLPRVRNAGGVFLGDGMSEALGDYAVGPSQLRFTLKCSSPERSASYEEFWEGRSSLHCPAPHTRMDVLTFQPLRSYDRLFSTLRCDGGGVPTRKDSGSLGWPVFTCSWPLDKNQND